MEEKKANSSVLMALARRCVGLPVVCALWSRCPVCLSSVVPPATVIIQSINQSACLSLQNLRTAQSEEMVASMPQRLANKPTGLVERFRIEWWLQRSPTDIYIYHKSFAASVSPGSAWIYLQLNRTRLFSIVDCRWFKILFGRWM